MNKQKCRIGGSLLENEPTVGWTNPHDNLVYYEGDIIPEYVFDSSGALVFGETCVRLEDAGFNGVVLVNHAGRMVEIEYSPSIPNEEIVEWVLKPIEPDENVFFIGPESPAWRWFYARRSTLSSRAMSMAAGEDMVV